MKKIVKWVGKGLCALAVAVAPMASEVCRIRFYQPEEPEHFRDFITTKRKKK